MTSLADIFGWFRTEAMIEQLDEGGKAILLDLLMKDSFDQKAIAKMALRLGIFNREKPQRLSEER